MLLLARPSCSLGPPDTGSDILAYDMELSWSLALRTSTTSRPSSEDQIDHPTRQRRLGGKDSPIKHWRSVQLSPLRLLSDPLDMSAIIEDMYPGPRD